MDIRPAQMPPNLPRDGVVRRVEPQSGSREFGEKQQSARRQPSRHAHPDDEAAQDTVDLSEQYLAASQAEETAPSDRAADPASASSGTEPRHLDIQV